MKWPTVSEAWMYRDPAEHADRLMARSARVERTASLPAAAEPASCVTRDRYYRQARRLHVLQSMKGHR